MLHTGPAPQHCSIELEISERHRDSLTASRIVAANSEQIAVAILLTGKIRLAEILKKCEYHCFVVIGSLRFMLAYF